MAEILVVPLFLPPEQRAKAGDLEGFIEGLDGHTATLKESECFWRDLEAEAAYYVSLQKGPSAPQLFGVPSGGGPRAEVTKEIERMVSFLSVRE